MLAEDSDRALVSLLNVEDAASVPTPSEGPSAERGAAVNNRNGHPPPLARNRAKAITIDENARQKEGASVQVAEQPPTTPKRTLPSATAAAAAAAPADVEVRIPVARAPVPVVTPRTVDMGGNLLETTDTHDQSGQARDPARRQSDDRAQLALEKKKYSRRPANAPPRLTFLGTLASTFITLLLLAVTTLLIGIPPLYMETLHTRTIYVALMIPVLTVVVTIMHYYVTEYPMRQVNLFMLKVAEEVERHKASMDANLAKVASLEARLLHNAQQQLEARRAAVAGGSGSITGGAQGTAIHGSTVTSVMPDSPARGSSVAGATLLRTGVRSPTGTSPAAGSRPTTLYRGFTRSFAQDDAATGSSTVPDGFLVDLQDMVASVAGDVRQQKAWMKRQLKKLDELHENAVHPEVHSQQKLLRYFLTSLFQFQATMVTAWAEGLVRSTYGLPLLSPSAVVAALGGTSGVGAATSSYYGGGVGTAFGLGGLDSVGLTTPSLSHATTPRAQALTPIRTTTAAPSPPLAAVPASRLDLASPLTFGSPSASYEKALPGGMQARHMDPDDLTFNGHRLESPERGYSRPARPVTSTPAFHPDAVELPHFTPLLPGLKPGVPTPPPTTATKQLLDSVQPSPSGGPPSASSESSPGELVAAVAREMQNVLSRQSTTKIALVEEPDETVKVDATDPSSAIQAGRGATPLRTPRAAAAAADPQDGAVTPRPQPPLPLAVSSAAATLTLKRGHRFVGDAAWVFFYVHLVEEVSAHPRTFSTSTNRPGSSTPLLHSRTGTSATLSPTKIIAFEALVSPKGNRNNTELPPFFSHDRVTHRPYAPFFVDMIRKRRTALSVLEQVRLDFGYCEVERDPAFANDSSSDRGDEGEENGESHGSGREVGQAGKGKGTPGAHASAATRQETGAANGTSLINVPSLAPAPKAGGTHSSSKNTPHQPSLHASVYRAGPLASSYVMSWKPFAERPMRLTFLSVLVDDGETDDAADSSVPKLPVPGHQKVWLPVLECLVDDVLCVLTDAVVRTDRSTSEVISVELHGISIEDISRSTSQLATSSSRSSDGSVSASSRELLDSRQLQHLAGRSTQKPTRRTRKADGATQPPPPHSTRTIGQFISEVVVMSNVVSGED